MRLLLFTFLLVLLGSCSSVSRGKLNRLLADTEKRFHDHTALVLYDIDKRKTIYDFNGAKYFTPASNTKIFTLYAGLKILGDSVPALEYVQRNDSLIFWGTGDPSFLYEEVFYDSTVYDFLARAEGELYFSSANFHTTHFGSGWAWDDYNSEYSPERSAFPVYGNVVSIIADHELLRITPDYFAPRFQTCEPRDEPEVVRDLRENTFKFYPGQKLSELEDITVPFHVDSATFHQLLADTLKRTVNAADVIKPILTNTLFSIHLDSLYGVMMRDSDNFIAEQLLLMCANVLSDTLKPEIAIKFMKDTHLSDLPDEPIWVDGSGLSRYNLFTPRSIVALWKKIIETVPHERLFTLLATGGVNGTIRNWYGGEKPYIFGKTGSLSNNHCLSGFLVTKKGKVLIFSFMSNNFVESGTSIRRNMQGIFEHIRNHY